MYIKGAFRLTLCLGSSHNNDSTLFRRYFIFTENMGILQKTRAQYNKIWPIYEGFKFEIKKSKFLIFPTANEKHLKSASYQDLMILSKNKV